MNVNSKAMRIAAAVSSMGTEIVLLTLGGAWLGKKLDVVWGTKPFMLLSGVLLGIGLGFVSAIYTLRALLKE
ncbi:AtpZ/AtpI family protein [Thermoactinomyces mirandus]|uniref:AtpZ/AtpI family protein n=1 Tax=Thermoactinomyces mirandus TaxID=2756294 RepID=A0A7W1XTG4_9BACL|nr:AtpZ/AtpI family protein [Thermoactinomyces mirandus]MBA4602954.1 AtpZ/AtpI family protein [Thermoactinomyces mirandus]